MAKLEIQNLTKAFGRLVAVDDLTLTVNDGEFLVLLGPNGAGKTTTLRCVAGLEEPESGHIRLGGNLIDEASPAARNVAFMFESHALYPRKTAFENMAFPLEARRLPRARIRERVDEVASLLHIEELLARRPSQLSGGEQQRVALGRTLVRPARIYLLDEPLTNLDFKLRVEMRTEFKRLHEELQHTFFYVTNDQTTAMAMADRVAVLNEGRLQQIGQPREVYDRPANLFVAKFVGSPRMNVLEGVLTTAEDRSDGAKLTALDASWALPIPDRLRSAIADAALEQAIIGIRPEDLTIRESDMPAALAGDVITLEPFGDRTIVDVAVSGEIVKVKAPPTVELESSQPVWLVPDMDRLHVFEPQTGEALSLS